MPTSAMKHCSKAGCGTLVPIGRCAAHTTGWNHTTSRQARGYGAQWERVRKQVLERDGHTCVVCGNPAREVDHRVPKARGGTDTIENLFSICTYDHRRKTARERLNV